MKFNMKKNKSRILGMVAAAVLAGATCLTSVSADQSEIKLVYDLKSYKEVVDENLQVTISSNYTSIDSSIDYIIRDTNSNLIFGANQPNIKGNKIIKASLYAEAYTKAGIKISNSYTYTTESIPNNFNHSTIYQYVNEEGKIDTNGDGLYETNIFSDIDADGYIEFSIPITVTNEINKFNISNYSFAKLGYDRENADSTYGFSKVRVDITYEVTDNKLNAADLAKNLICEDKAFINENNNPIYPEYYGITAFSAGKTVEATYPFKSTLYPKNGENNVIAALTAPKKSGSYYTAPVAVINDVIANNEDVIFTFVTYNGYVVNGRGYDTKQDIYTWYNPTFSQHLYSSYYSPFGVTAYDNYGSYSSAWGINLFSGGLVVNSEVTMQLNETDAFTWGDNTLTFKWSDITSDEKVSNAKGYLSSMLLYTPVDWYWDSLIISTDNTEEIICGDVTAGAGLEEETEIIIDEDSSYEEIITPIDDELPIEVIEENDEIVTDTKEETAEVLISVEETTPEITTITEEIMPVSESPKTGNPSAILSVIPVACAALAIIAKKKK